jgi:Xaa-Pro aminopeptidase
MLTVDAENAALPHGSGTDRVLGKKDMVLIDAGGEWGGYVADITRVSPSPLHNSLI